MRRNRSRSRRRGLWECTLKPWGRDSPRRNPARPTGSGWFITCDLRGVKKQGGRESPATHRIQTSFTFISLDASENRDHTDSMATRGRLAAAFLLAAVASARPALVTAQAVQRSLYVSVVDQ